MLASWALSECYVLLAESAKKFRVRNFGNERKYSLNPSAESKDAEVISIITSNLIGMR
jgi:hypothetical protein